MTAYGGWAGKILRVDLSTGMIRIEDTIAQYRNYLGGTGIGYKVMWEEVPAGVKPYDPENRIIFAVGPLAGTGRALQRTDSRHDALAHLLARTACGIRAHGRAVCRQTQICRLRCRHHPGKSRLSRLAVHRRPENRNSRCPQHVGAGHPQRHGGRLRNHGTGCGRRRHRPGRGKSGAHVRRDERRFPLRRRHWIGHGLQEPQSYCYPGHRQPPDSR